jgi:putative hemolysin
LTDLKDILKGKNVMVIYRKVIPSKDIPIMAVSFDFYNNQKMIVSIKPGIRIPKILLPGIIKQPQKTLADLKNKIKNKGNKDGEASAN